MGFVQVAIDGPAVSGKSSAAKRLAFELSYLYLDSGAIYRSITLAHLRGMSLDAEGLSERLDGLGIALKPIQGQPGCEVYLGEENVSEPIRTQHVTDNIRPVAGDPLVRDWVTNHLRQASQGANVVMDGRDIASVVFPKAQYKFFVTASIEARVERRLSDMNEDEKRQISPAQLAELLEKRDASDRAREVGPLVQVPEATFVDNSKLNLQETVAFMVEHMGLSQGVCVSS